jgi:hypothetical protein
MKAFFLIILLGSGAFAFGQSAPDTLKKSHYPPAAFLDSQRINLSRFYINPANIQDVKAYGGFDPIGHTNGSIYITWKNPHPNLLTLKDISENLPGLSGKKILYIIGDSLITDTAMIRIDPSAIIRIHAASAKEVTYIRGVGDQLALLFIELIPGNNNNAHEKRILLQ